MVEFTNNIIPKKRRPLPSVWGVLALFIAGMTLLPIASIVWLALFPSTNIWPHLWATTLPRYAVNSFTIMLGTGLLSALVGTSTAWLVVMYRFPGHRLLQWALLLPIALPAYIAAFVLVDFWEYAGAAQSFLRATFGWTSPKDYAFFNIRSHGAAIVVMSSVLYPYVYFLARSVFVTQSTTALEVSRALGCGPLTSFLRVGLPLARPAIIAGTALVMMETLNEFGAMEFFAIQTLTTGIFTVWLEAGNAGGAAQISCTILLFVITLVFVEKLSRRRIRFHDTSKQQRPITKTTLKGLPAFSSFLICTLPVLVGFVLPISLLLHHALDSTYPLITPSLISASITSFGVASAAALLTVIAGIALVFGARQIRAPLFRQLIPITTIGYAAPGAVLGLGLLIPLAAFDNWVADFWLDKTNQNIGLLLTGTVFAVVLAYFVRFFAIAFGTIDAAFTQRSPNLDHAARSLGHTPSQTLRKIHLPLLKGAAGTAALLIFVDCIKELPATLLLRPFGMETLSTSTYSQASLENIPAAAIPALTVVLISLTAVLVAAHSNSNLNGSRK